MGADSHPETYTLFWLGTSLLQSEARCEHPAFGVWRELQAVVQTPGGDELNQPSQPGHRFNAASEIF